MIREWRAVRRSLFLPGSRKFWNLKNDTHRLIFVSILVSADDEGRLEGTSEDVKMLSPRSKWSLRNVSTAIKDMEKAKLIVAYDGYIQILNFVEMQSWHGITGRGSNIPSPPNQNQVSTNTVLDSTNTVTRSSHDMHDNHDYHGISDLDPVKEGSGEGTFDFRVFGKKWRHIAGRGAPTTDTNKRLYFEKCSKYGEDAVLKCIDPWTQEQDDSFLKKPVSVWKFLSEGVDEIVDSIINQPAERTYPELTH